ncbi:MAG: hypothetical protein M0P01_04435 [Treponema sp.]|nr:hypothetical protein [Treponema sp.]
MEQLSSENEFDLIMPHMIEDKKVDGIIVLGQISSDTEKYNLSSVMFKNRYCPGSIYYSSCDPGQFFIASQFPVRIVIPVKN